MRHLPRLIALAMCGIWLMPACSPLAASPEPAAAQAATALPTSAAAQAATIIPTAVQPEPAATLPEAAPTPVTVQKVAACTSSAGLTPAETEGPYFKAGSPERASLLTSGMPGTKLVLAGFVWTADCKPVEKALIEFWQADANGVYDNAGYTLRGHQYTAADGSYRLETVVPGLYPGRTEHIHVKVQAPGGPLLTTQLFFPGVQQNDSDGIYDSRLLMEIQKSSTQWDAVYSFVVATQ